MPNFVYRERLISSYVSKRTKSRLFSDRLSSYEDWSRSARLRFSKWLPEDPEAKILDLGCGHGNFLHLVRSIGYTSYLGVDMSAEQLELARMIDAEASLEQGDLMSAIRNPQTSYDLIACLNIVEHLERDDIVNLFDYIFRALKPGGRVIVETPNAESPWFGASAYGDMTHEWFFTPRELENALRQAGLFEFEARASRPYAQSIAGILRVVVWGIYDSFLKVWNLAETGSIGSGIYTRVFVATARKPLLGRD